MLHSTGWLTGASTQERTFPGKYAAGETGHNRSFADRPSRPPRCISAQGQLTGAFTQYTPLLLRKALIFLSKSMMCARSQSLETSYCE